MLYRLSPAALRLRLKDSMPFGVERIPLHLPEGRRLLFDHLECSKILRRFAWKGIYGYEPHTLRLFYALAKRARGVIDVGAYFGLYALVAARANPAAVIHAFEPVPQNLELLRHFLALNACTQVQAHGLAIARASGEAILYVPVDRRSALPATGSLKDSFRPGGRLAKETPQTLRVQTMPLDEVLAQLGVGRVDLLKIDTEETEHEVIASGRRMIARDHPDIVMEVIFGNPRAADALAELRAFGYRFFEIGAEGLVSFDEMPARAQPDLVNCEILCTCRPAAELPRG